MFTILILAVLTLTPQPQQPRPAEDDAYVARTMNVAQALAPDATLVYEASKRAVFAGVVFPGQGGIECALGNTWERSTREWTGIRIVCP